jgi:hypothetical protein
MINQSTHTTELLQCISRIINNADRIMTEGNTTGEISAYYMTQLVGQMDDKDTCKTSMIRAREKQQSLKF